MKVRLNYKQISPDVFRLMVDNEEYIKNCGLEAKLIELVKIRASQINGCASCLKMHTKDARAISEKEERIYAISAWRETNLYSPREQAALALTEVLTEISNKHLTDELYNEIRKHFNEEDFVDLMFLINSINNWNRFNIALTIKEVPEIY